MPNAPQIPWKNHDGTVVGHIVHEVARPDGSITYLAKLDTGGYESGIVR